MRYLSITISCIMFLSLIATDCIAGDEQDLFLSAKKKCIDQEWYEAINHFEQLLEKYPRSRYEDDARFWIAYSLEKIPEKQEEAFFAFSDFVADLKQSPWVDDALSHQINLAEQFIRSGKDQYRQFLYNLLNSEMNEIRNRSALALGKLGDPRAVPVLKNLTNDEDYGLLAANLIAVLGSKPVKTGRDTSVVDMEIVFDHDLDTGTGIREDGTAPKREEFLWFGSQRYDQYRSMLRKDDKWNKQELERFALWHVLDGDEFDEYNSLSSDYDRKEWLRKFWKEQDPTPTTDINEKQIEFERRVKYVRANFSKPWDYRHFRYLPDQYIRTGWYHAPWDARGELYIKFGEPDIRSVHTWQTEEWIYYKYAVDFLVKQFMTNIYGNAINAGSLTRGLHSNQNFPFEYDYNYIYSMLNNEQQEYLDWNTYNNYLDVNFVYKNEMRYEYNYDAEPISDFEMEAFGSDSVLTIRYQFPADELELQSSGEKYGLSYFERFTILDEDMRQVSSGENTREITDITDKDIVVEKTINCDLSPGIYHIAIYLKDNNSKKLGIYKLTVDSHK